MGSIPHSRASQIDANNLGKYDQWLEAKRSDNQKYSDIPMTMGYYTREDLPFHYAMADAFTICDQYFCSAMTGTWPNRLFLWGGTIRGEKSGDAKAYIRNEIPYGEAHWKTFPERLEENDVSWRVYQNDISSGGGFSVDERSWLANYRDNPLEFLSQYNVRFSRRYVAGLQKLSQSLPEEIANLEKEISLISLKGKNFEKLQRKITEKKKVLKNTQEELVRWSSDNFAKLSQMQKSIYQKAFTTNEGDADYHELETLIFEENGAERKLSIPKGDLLYQFRKDVDSGKLPTVSWLVPPQNFSDHPSAPWYGAWYTSEVLDILTKNPEVWKKTIFILTYDENDGYFDHVPPFVSPDPTDPQTGKCSKGINVSGVEFIRSEQEIREGVPKKDARSGPIGLGFRVPMIIASPWSRGGNVCSQVFDHTSVLQFLEEFLSKKFNKEIKQTNISEWRRTVCGDLTSAFSMYQGEIPKKLPFLPRDSFLEKIYNAQFKNEPSDFKKLSASEIVLINRDPSSSSLMPEQESGLRPACPLPYQLYANGKLSADKKKFELTMKAGNEVFGSGSAGSPFNVYAPGRHLFEDGNKMGRWSFEKVRTWHYAVTAGDTLTDLWPLGSFEKEDYHLRVYGPNGFFREFIGNSKDPFLEIDCDYQRTRLFKNKLTGSLEFRIKNSNKKKPYYIDIKDMAYENGSISKVIPLLGAETIVLNIEKSYGWYDFILRIKGYPSYLRRYAGRVETGKESYSDPLMGRRFLLVK